MMVPAMRTMKRQQVSQMTSLLGAICGAATGVLCSSHSPASSASRKLSLYGGGEQRGVRGGLLHICVYSLIIFPVLRYFP